MVKPKSRIKKRHNYAILRHLEKMRITKKIDLVVDISAYQDDSLAFFHNLKAMGVKAVIIKVTQGSKYGDHYKRLNGRY